MGYPIVRVGDVVGHVRMLEDALVGLLADEGVDAHARPQDGPDYTGVWVGERKLASIGVHLDSTTAMRRGSEIGPEVLELERLDHVGLVEEVVLDQRSDLSLPGASEVSRRGAILHEERLPDRVVTVQAFDERRVESGVDPGRLLTVL